MNKKTLILIICLLVIAIAGAFAWVFWPKEKESSKPSLVLWKETDIWNTFQDEDFGFEIKYPNDFYFETDKSSNEIYFKNQKDKDNPSAGCEFHISMEPNPLEKTPEKWFTDNSTKAEFATDEQEKSGKLYFNSDQAQLQRIIINGIDALKFYQIGGYPNDWINVLMENNTYMFEITYFPNCSETERFEQMLSTFKFINTRWKTYRSNSLGFELKYPEEFKATTEIALYTENSILDINFEGEKYFFDDAYQVAYVALKAEENLDQTTCHKTYCCKYTDWSFDALTSSGLPEILQINNNTFYRYVMGQADMQASTDEIQYSAFYNNICYRLDLVVIKSSGPYKMEFPGEAENDQLRVNRLAETEQARITSDEAIFKTFKQILSTFKFINQ
jgi:hypothetical protein